MKYWNKLQRSLPLYLLSLIIVNCGQAALANIRTIYAQDGQGRQSKQ